MVDFIEKSGETLNDVIVIMNAKGSAEGVNAEYKYLKKKYGMLGRD
ncbi:MAG: hypothetical protein ACUVWP_08535 [bacterium]